MEKHQGKSSQSPYSGNAAVYQPDQVQLKRTVTLVLLLLTVLLIGLATRSHGEQRPVGTDLVLQLGSAGE